MHKSEGFLVVSDLHVGAIDQAQDHWAARLESLASYAFHHRLHLIIAGDLFDWWMDYPTARPISHYPFLKQWQVYIEKGLQITLIPGNHDYWIDDSKTLAGIEIKRELLVLETSIGSVLIFHGDGFDQPAKNLPKPMLHRWLQHPWFIATYQALLPPRVGWKVMAYFSSWKRSPNTSTQRLDLWAQNTLPSLDATIAVCGHDHEHRVSKVDEKWYVNLGLFVKDQVAFQYKNKTLSLVRIGSSSHESWSTLKTFNS
ncbi:MAG: metallophosphoesterase family protein [Balneolaceae bacterium]|nr:metallophosphoesterase family protein [Balneolaceae bacterium]